MFGIYNIRHFGIVSDQITEKLISEKKKIISAVKSSDEAIKHYHSCVSMPTISCTFLSTDDPVGIFLCLNWQEVRWCPGVSSLSDSGQPQVSQALL